MSFPRLWTGGFTAIAIIQAANLDICEGDSGVRSFVQIQFEASKLLEITQISGQFP